MRSLSPGQILVVFLVLTVVTVAPGGALSLAVVDETQSDFQAGTTTGDAEVFNDDTVGIRPAIGTTATADITPVSAGFAGGGIKFVPKSDLEGVRVSRFDESTFRLGSEVELQDSSGNTLITKSANSPTTVFEYNFTAGETYQIQYYTGGTVAEGVKSQSALNTPYTSADIDITGPGDRSSDLKNVETITAIKDAKSTGNYSTTLAADNAQEAFVDFATLEGSAEIVVSNASGTIAQQTIFSAGESAVQIDPTASGEYDVTIAYENDIDQTQTVDRVGVRFNSSTPQLSGASPSNSQTVTDSPVGLTVDVSDADFGTSQGDSVTVEFYDGDGTQLGSDTVSQNGTATANYSDPAGGANEWYAVATDSYGNTVTSQNFTFNAPAEIEIRSEQTGELLTGVDVTLEFYEQSATNEIYSPPVTDGSADMTGLPADENFIAVAEADGYVNRRIFIDSLIETQTIYLLNSSADAVAVEFELDDFSGQYQQDTSVLVVEREINGSYTPIQGDFFGAAGTFEATLVRDVRHRLRIRNLETGREAVIGTFTPQSSGPQTLTIEPDGDIQLTQQSERVSAQPALGVIGATDDAAFTVDIDEGDTTIQNYSVVVEHRPGNGSTETLATRSGSGAASEDFALNLTDKDGIIAAEVTTTTSSGTTTTLITREIRESYPGANGLVGGLNDVGIGLNAGDGASGASSMTAFLVSVLVTAGVGSQSGSVEVSGLAALGSLSGFAILGWLSMQVLFASAVAFGAMVLLRRGI